MIFKTNVRCARLTYAVIMSIGTCLVMSAVSTSVLSPPDEFWQHWPHVLGIDLMVAIPVAVALGPVVRRLCSYLYPDLLK